MAVATAVAPPTAPPVHAEEHQGSTGQNTRKLLMWAFLGSDCMFFGSLIGTYLVYRGRAHEGPLPYDVFSIPYTSVSAFALLMSSLAMVLALAAIQRGDIHRLKIWLLTTAGLGLVFIGGQIYEFTTFGHEALNLSVSTFGTTLFMLARRGVMTQARSLDVEIAGLYWHFVDIVWIIIFTVVYLIPI